MVMQDPKFSLNPVMTIGRQLMEALEFGASETRAEAKPRALAMLEAVQIRDPELAFRACPHDLPGGMGQRAMIAMMPVTEPGLLIADEPTSALNASIHAEVLNLPDRLCTGRGLTYVVVSHGLAVIAHMCDRLIVMQHGAAVEELTRAALSAHRAATYHTKKLLSAPEGDTPA